MTNEPNDTKTNLQEVIARNHRARHILAGTSAENPNLTETLRDVDAALLDVAHLIAETIEIRLNIAFLAAAAKATLRAHDDGISDPLWFLRDELDAQGWTDQRRA